MVVRTVLGHTTDTQALLSLLTTVVAAVSEIWRSAGNPGPKWREQDKVWLKATKTIRPGQRLYTAYGVGSTHHKKIVKECQDFEAAKDHAKIARCIAMGAAQVKNNKNARKNANIANLNKRRR